MASILFNETQIKEIFESSVITTTLLINEIIVQTKGEFIIDENLSIKLVEGFRARLIKKIMPPNKDEISKEAKIYIAEILKTWNDKNSENNDEKEQCVEIDKHQTR